ncbi:putative centromere protein L-like [Apostichopus japonicus]|uniref:Centromere protein L n=1 Tax=Stichopus japonicus TaxID=307972 RepID=A0A2G8LNK0_STIJA|nr:putative centromere protein L-like [Apostichopus japonicus]
MAEVTSTPTFIDTNRQSLKSRSHFANWTGRTRRFTPYTKTPKSRKSVQQASRHGDKEQGIPLKRFVNKTWYVYQVTPLYQFLQDAGSLKRYSRHLSSHLQSEAQKGHGFETGESLGARALFQKYRD